MSRAGRWLRATGRFVVEQRWPLAIFVAALLVRLHWNLRVHPPGDYLYSDMNGYMQRAQGALADPFGKREYAGFYPWGTHVMIAGLQAVFGKPGHTAIAIVYALLGSFTAMFGMLAARRVTRFAFVAPAVGLLLVLDYPLISLGGYVLSEVPFAFGLAGATWMLMRMVDEGRSRDAWLTGIFVGWATVMRPQILLSVALLGVLWALRRKLFPRLTVPLLVRTAIPIALVLAFSSWRLYHHTGRVGLICENGTFNQVFGRCHNTKIIALPDKPGGGRTLFGPPPLLQLAKRAERAPGQWPQLDPILDEHLYYHGYIGDAKILGGYMRECIEKGGWGKQAEFALVNTLMLWRYNIVWPDSGKTQWKEHAKRWGMIHSSVFAIPALLAMLVVFVPRRHPKLAIVGLHLVAALITAAIYFGDVRLRTPYDPFIFLLALEFAAMVGFAVATRIRRRGAAAG